MRGIRILCDGRRRADFTLAFSRCLGEETSQHLANPFALALGAAGFAGLMIGDVFLLLKFLTAFAAMVFVYRHGYSLNYRNIALRVNNVNIEPQSTAA